MLSHEENELICRTGPGTPMGKLMREYWVPAMMSEEVSADGDPVRVLLLGEKLIGFRDSDGRPGLIQNHCPHRGASLFFGRNEESGLRCVYHGWKFDVTGQCVDMPNEPAESNFKNKVKATAYPCQERGGVIWAYMGPRVSPPPLPSLEANMLPEGEYRVSAMQRECNWLQAGEGDIDTSHFGFLHRGSVDPEELKGTMLYWAMKDRAPRYKVVDTEYGTMYGAYRDAEPGFEYWRIALYMFPFYFVPPGGTSIQARVPMDDEHTMTFLMSTRMGGIVGLSGEKVKDPDYARWKTGMLPNTTEWYGRYMPGSTMRNDYEIDREQQRRNRGNNGYTGIVGNMQDQAITEAMGPIYDRTQERLGTSDGMIIRTRRRILNAIRAHENGMLPPGVDDPDIFAVRSANLILPKGVDWIEATQDVRKAFGPPPVSEMAGAN